MVEVTEEFYQGQSAFRIETPAATYYFHKEGAGLASIIDRDNRDWISYRPNGGVDGKYRGIPNIKYPEDYFHPGSTNACSRIVSLRPDYCQIHAQTLDGVCEALWDFYPQFVQMNLLKAPHRYWLLYEGTPGGVLDEHYGYIIRSDGTKTLLGHAWEATLDPGWLYFFSPTSSKVLFIAQAETELKLSSYFPMESTMTVFGFGRIGLEHYLEKTPARFLFGLLEAGEHQTIHNQINKILSNATTPYNLVSR